MEAYYLCPHNTYVIAIDYCCSSKQKKWHRCWVDISSTCGKPGEGW